VPSIYNMKYLLLVLDGGGDRGENTPLQVAHKPNIDSLSAAGKNGLLDLGYKREVNSDVGYLTLLSCYSKDEYPGRGYIEVLGVNILPGKRDLCIRGNFATLDSRGNIKDRRAGRDETGLKGLAEKLDGMEIDGVGFTVIKSTGHRVIIIASGPSLSDSVRPNDPMKTGVPLPQVTARSPQARFTASVLNKFVYRANKVLSKEPVNRRRELPANTILFRNFGMKREAEGFEDRFGLKGCCVAGVNVAKGVARFLGMDVIEVKGATGRPDTDLAGKREAAVRALKKHDFVFLHINGTDVLAHDRNRAGKAEFIERIDKEMGKLLEHVNLEETCIVVTCDHRTVSLPFSKYRDYEHVRDPVPIVISGDGIKPDEVKTFNEYSVKRGSLKMSGTELVPLLLMLTRKR
jgi:2,3-bisphosphoglycerate-independent phosphoglycerate mutase